MTEEQRRKRNDLLWQMSLCRKLMRSDDDYTSKRAQERYADLMRQMQLLSFEVQPDAS